MPVLFDLGFYFPRFSLLAFYYKLFPISEPRLRVFLYIVTFYTIACFFTTAGLDLLSCGFDIAKNW